MYVFIYLFIYYVTNKKEKYAKIPMQPVKQSNDLIKKNTKL